MAWKCGSAEDGEILTRGPHVMLGYLYGRSRHPPDHWMPDGWLHTGDLGSMDADAHVTITGRRKEILVLSSGKNVAYAHLWNTRCSAAFIFSRH
jgi:long-chain acyl-CoA synthetase